jgi:hypothetical protein
LTAHHSSSRRRLDAFDWRGPPELIEHVSISEDERLLIAAFALQRFKTASPDMDRTQPSALRLEKMR